MRMKEDHMLNGQLKPAYNWQISTQNQFILNYSLHQNPTDTLTLKPHLEQYQALYGLLPSAVVADAGYGSDENYQLLEQKAVAAYLKYNTFDREQHDGISEFSGATLHYNPQQDCLYCPMGQQMNCIGKYTRQTASGHCQTISRYQASNCQGCPMRGVCHKNKGNRIIEINHDLNRRKEKARQLLSSEQGIKYRKQRPADVEPVFAQIKSNNGFRRFLTKGLSKTEVEIGLLSIAHNLKKWSA